LEAQEEPTVTFKAYLEKIQAKTGKMPQEFLELAKKKGFVKDGKIVAKHADLLRWLKSEIGLGHGHANAIILYLRMRTNDPKVERTPA
jgi:Domain of unknown function (DUF4287)